MDSTDSSTSSPPPHTSATATAAAARPTRSSLACLPCRSRHIKCDGKRPQCSRCLEAGKECHYAKSRRGGLDRAALAERRKQLAGNEAGGGGCGVVDGTDGLISYAATTDNAIGNGTRPASLLTPSSGNPSAGMSPGIMGFPGDTTTAAVSSCLGQGTTTSMLHTGLLVDSMPYGRGLIRPSSPPSLQHSISVSSITAAPTQIVDVESDPLLHLYYDNFHNFHPCALPRRHLIASYRDPTQRPRLAALVAVQRHIGHLYGAKEWSEQLRAHVDDCLLSRPHHPADTAATGTSFPDPDPFMVQARLLYSVALFWYRRLPQSRQQMDAAVACALELGMHRREFAAEHGCGDPVLEESWRRTWWQVCFIDGAYAGTTGARTFATMDVDSTADLPCEEAEYESGMIPQPPKTLQDFDSREFLPDGGSFSSFAYLVGAARCSALAIATAPEVASPETSPRVLQTADSIIDGWLLLLPKHKREVMRRNGDIDEMLFQAHLLIHVATISLHRPLSDLKFNAVEDVSSCAREPPRGSPPGRDDLANVHTVRVLRSVEAQIRLLALPSPRPFCHHTPFATCMVSEGTLALLSACRFLLRGRDLAVARDQIRMSIGCLRALGDVWPRTAKNVQEIQIIARHVLGIDPPPSASASASVSGGGDGAGMGAAGGDYATGSSLQHPGSVPSLTGGEGHPSSGSDTGASSEGQFSLSNIDGLCGWLSPAEMGPELSWWINGT